MMIAKELVRKRFEKGFDTYHKKAIVQQEIAEKLVEELALADMDKQKRVLEIGTGTGFLTQKLLSRFQINEMVLNDLAKTTLHIDNSEFLKYTFIQGDAEKTTFPGQFDAVLSTSTFQWFTDLPGFFSKIKHNLKREGLLGFSTFCQQNFKEIRNSLNVGLEYSTVDTITNLLSDDYEIITVKEWVKEVLFENPYKVLRHIKETGTNALCMEYLGKQKLREFEKFYSDHYTKENGFVSLTYHPVIIIAKKK